MSIVSNSLKRIKPSPTLTVSQKARELKAAGEDVIGAHRLAGKRKAELEQAVVEHLAPPLVLFGHGRESLLAFPQRGDGGGLGQRAGADKEVLLQPLEGGDQVFRSDQPADPQPCHGVAW